MNVAEKVYLGTNLKMYMTNSETRDYLYKIRSLCENKGSAHLQLFVIPSFTSLAEGTALVDHKQILIGAQNMHWAEQGQFTGEVSPRMLRDLNMDLVELGHSERRMYFGETDEQINRKVLSALGFGFIALLCIGETKEQKEAGQADEVLSRQLLIGLRDVEPREVGRIWVAYEPVWSIGVDGRPADPDYVAERGRSIRQTLYSLFGKSGETIPLLYGGSVNLDNASCYNDLDEINGLFVGRYAWDAERFAALIDKVGQS